MTNRWRITAVLLVGAALASGSLAEEPAAGALRLQMAVERQLAAEVLTAHGEARRRQGEARRQLDQILDRLDEQLGNNEPGRRSQASLIELDLGWQQHAARHWEEECQRLRHRLYEHWRRMELLQEKIESLEGVTAAVETDVVTGGWTVRLLPSGQVLTFQLRLDVTVVTGSYRGEGETRGSLRGTLVGDRLSLERIDSRRGLDLIFEGRLERERGEIRGTWRSTLLTSADAPGGNWVATRMQPRTGEALEPR